MGTLSTHIPDDLQQAVDARIAEHFDGKPSRYLRSLIERDITNKEPPNPESPTIIEDLAHVLLGSLKANELATHLEHRDQPRVLENLLRELLRFLEASGPLDSFTLVNADQMMELAWTRAAQRSDPGDVAGFLKAVDQELKNLRSRAVDAKDHPVTTPTTTPAAEAFGIRSEVKRQPSPTEKLKRKSTKRGTAG